jgi:spore coat polysaccharide biosynthesis protein SpsF (cytidylyltransferase family)
VEIASRRALDAAAARATDPYDREHVTPYLRTRPREFLPLALYMEPDLGSMRLTLDTAEDLAVLRDTLSRVAPDASFPEILAAHGYEPDRIRLRREPPLPRPPRER